MNDTFTIGFFDLYDTYTLFDDGEGILFLTPVIKKLEGYPPAIIFYFAYVGDEKLSLGKVILKPGDTRYTFEVNSNSEVSDGFVYEFFNIPITDKSFGLLEDIIGNELKSVKLRLVGDREVKATLFMTDNLEALYNDYITAGGLDGDFTAITQPCDVN